MFARKALTVLVLAGSVLGIPTVSLAATAATSPSCELRERHVVSVEPYRPEEHVGRATFPVLRGARLYVQAEPGLTAEWLRHSLARHIAAQQSSDCALDVDGLKVDVQSAGPGFWVTLSAPESKTGEEILRRARRLVG
ncbi:hypothetical protein LZC95_41315 [Pendulispora brunnea]|uniref:Uncharacterized protein n=1 Tax=Pendulispora brunnea TaxID=2905690 RepID=A0ABZ2K2D6_9BACT